MRVVWITHNYPRHAGDVAGSFLHPLAVELRRRDVDIRIVAPSDSGQGGPAELEGVPVNRVRYGTATEESLAYGGTMATAIRSPWSMLTFNRLRAALHAGAIEALAAAGADSLVHAHWWIPGGLAAPNGVPLVLTCHGTDVRMLERVPFSAILARRVMRHAKVVTTVSRQLSNKIRERTGVTVASDAIQPMPVVAVHRNWSTGDGEIVFVGRLSRQKRVDLVIGAMAIARKEGMRRRLSIVGDGPERSALERQAGDLGVSDVVRFLGEVPPSAVPEVFATASCCVMPAKSEGFGLAAAEALMQGVPVVACTDGGGVLDIVPVSGAGRVVEPLAGAIAAALLDVLSDPDARAAARAEGANWRERLSPSFVADRCLTWYHRALHA